DERLADRRAAFPKSAVVAALEVASALDLHPRMKRPRRIRSPGELAVLTAIEFDAVGILVAEMVLGGEYAFADEHALVGGTPPAHRNRRRVPSDENVVDIGRLRRVLKPRAPCEHRE